MVNRMLRVAGVAACALLVAAGGFAGRGTSHAAAQQLQQVTPKLGTTLTSCTACVLTLTASSTDGGTGHPVTLTAASNLDVGPTVYYIFIFDNFGNELTECGSGNTCSVPVEIDACTSRTYHATIARFDYTDVQATSNSVGVTWWNVTLSVSPTGGQVILGTIHLTATTCRDVGPTVYFIDISNATTTALLASCGFGTSCGANDTEVVPICFVYAANIERGPGATSVATRDQTVCWSL